MNACESRSALPKFDFEVGDRVTWSQDNGVAPWLLVVETDETQGMVRTHHWPAGTRWAPARELTLVAPSVYMTAEQLATLKRLVPAYRICGHCWVIESAHGRIKRHAKACSQFEPDEQIEFLRAMLAEATR